jgi:hypothetical protein
VHVTSSGLSIRFARIALAVVISSAAVGFLTVRQVYSDDASPAYTVFYTETSKSLLNNQTIERHMFFASRSDRSYAMGSTDNPDQERVIVDPSLKRRTLLTDSARVKSTLDYSGITGVVRTLRARSNPTCSQDSSREHFSLVGTEVVHGIVTYHYQTPAETITDGMTEERHYWFAPDLGCFEVQLKAFRRDKDGTLNGLFAKEMTGVRLGEPSGTLFSIPADYTEVKPSEVERAGLGAGDRLRPPPEGVRARWTSEDLRYEELKKKQSAAPH